MTPAWALLCGLELAAIFALAVWAFGERDAGRIQRALVERLVVRLDTAEAFTKALCERADRLASEHAAKLADLANRLSREE